MGFSFALKDIFRHSEQTRAYFRNSISIFTLFFVFWNVIRGFGFLFMPSSIQMLNYTIYEIITQFYFFLFIITSILAISIILLNNHAIIQDRKKDIAIMKAIGTYPSHLYSFYLSELLFLVIISFLLAWVFAFFIYLAIYLILSPIISIVSWNSDQTFSFLFFAGMLFATFMVNGWEIRKIGRITYSEAKSGIIKAETNWKIQPAIQKWLAKRSSSINLAVRNVLRKKYKVRQTLWLISIANLIVFSSLFGLVIINSTGQNYIAKAQSDYVVAIGENTLLKTYANGYSSFTNSDVSPLLEKDFLDINSNLTDFSSDLSNYLDHYDINGFDARLFTVQTITEDPGVVLQTYVNLSTGIEYQEYVLIGGKDSRTIPIQGVIFNQTFQDWYYEGALLNYQYGVAIGDTLAGEIYENPYVQWLIYSSLDTNRTYRLKVNAVVFDTFNHGNSAYIYLNTLQETLKRPNYINLILIDYSSLMFSAENNIQNSFLEGLDTLVKAKMGSNFGIVDLSSIFSKNMKSLQINTLSLLSLIALMSIVVSYNLYNFERGRIHEDKKDYAILLSLGARFWTLRKTIFFELLFFSGIGVILGFISAMFFTSLFLMQNAIRPSILVPLSILFGMMILFIGLAMGISRMFRFKKYIDYLSISA
ncbi:FtsX-like permease family protein [Candidatus Harpocratesius sp.]